MSVVSIIIRVVLISLIVLPIAGLVLFSLVHAWGSERGYGYGIEERDRELEEKAKE